MKRIIVPVAAIAFALLISNFSSAAEDKLVVHEWGTFTSLQDEQGNAIGGLNIDDEPLPEFVHDISMFGLIGRDDRPHETYAEKGLPAIGPHPQITMRLETPVMYFYPPAGQGKMTLDVGVEFRGGWLSQFYPNAEAAAPGIDSKPVRFGPLTGETVGSLRWKGLTIGGEGAPPKTNSPIWLAPRAVKAVTVTTADGKESEKYLFYRGVGNIMPTLTVKRSTDSSDASHFELFNGPGAGGEAGFPLVHARTTPRERAAEVSRQDYEAWVVQIRSGGALAFHGITARQMNEQHLSGTPGAAIGDAWVNFRESDFAGENLQRLRGEMHAALVAQGLFPDEAHAMLNTWEASYFKSPGQRLFYVVPRKWTDHVLPLKISVPAEVVRVMMGRIELITPEQRGLVKKIAAGDVRPETYHDLGRFRNSILLDQQRRATTDALDAFIKKNHLEGYTLPPT